MPGAFLRRYALPLLLRTLVPATDYCIALPFAPPPACLCPAPHPCAPFSPTPTEAHLCVLVLFIFLPPTPCLTFFFLMMCKLDNLIYTHTFTFFPLQHLYAYIHMYVLPNFPKLPYIYLPHNTLHTHSFFFALPLHIHNTLLKSWDRFRFGLPHMYWLVCVTYSGFFYPAYPPPSVCIVCACILLGLIDGVQCCCIVSVSHLPPSLPPSVWFFPLYYLLLLLVLPPPPVCVMCCYYYLLPMQLFPIYCDSTLPVFCVGWTFYTTPACLQALHTVVVTTTTTPAHLATCHPDSVCVA